ncbi:MAG: FAD-dependent oxidoreductase [Candidatus Omnitrophica bacterium]|nr:FAD-dependent oxidoreductase [Candidatus Omnitrophota bacterium]MBD3268574.1 FAD-dependent oxidoreductase [Candidatus Omnitrophota bacterium]
MKNNKSPKIAIIGGGISGLATAYFLRSAGIKSEVFEKDSRVGGLCKSVESKGFTFDYCGHLLHFKNQKTLPFLKGILKNNLVKHKRNAWVYTFDTSTHYPFQVNLHGLPPRIVKKCMVDFIKASTSRKDKKPHNFLEWCRFNLGNGITDYFMYPYNRKFWTLDPAKLSYEWVNNFIVLPNLKQVIDGTLEESKRNFGYHSFFWYPRRGGIEELIKGLAGPLRRNIHINHEVEQINTLKKEIVFTNGAVKRYDFLISTAPLPSMKKIVKNLSKDITPFFKDLKWVSIFNLNLGIKGIIKPGWHWIYFPEKKYKFFRVGFPHNFSNTISPPNRSSLYIEISYSKSRRLRRKNIIDRIVKDLIKSDIIPSRDCIEEELVNDIVYAYPVYDFNWAGARKILLDHLRNRGIISIGRFGSWRYMSMEDVILEARATAGNVIKKVTGHKSAAGKNIC